MAKILLIDDSGFQRKCMSRILSAMGHEVTEAGNGKIGLQILDTVKPDVIITDLLMPEVDGTGLLRSLKERGYATPALVVSADIQESTKQECLQLGAKAILNKPVNAAGLKAALDPLITPDPEEKSKC